MPLLWWVFLCVIKIRDPCSLTEPPHSFSGRCWSYLACRGPYDCCWFHPSCVGTVFSLWVRYIEHLLQSSKRGPLAVCWWASSSLVPVTQECGTEGWPVASFIRNCSFAKELVITCTVSEARFLRRLSTAAQIKRLPAERTELIL